MKDHALTIAKNAANPHTAKNELREYLQHLILRKLFELNLNKNMVFHGGTALRIVHELARFSEDLDFHTRRGDYPFDLSDTMTKVKKDLAKNGYTVSTKLRTQSAVHSALIRFTGLLYESGLSPLPDENLTIKIEIDTNPPSGFSIDRSTINKYFPFSIIHHDPPSFLAGKCRAILQRQYTKGRDFFDLMFYLSRWNRLEPNFNYLNNCLAQTGYEGGVFSMDNWKTLLLNHLEQTDWKLVVEDVAPFISSNADLQLLTLETFKQLLKKGHD